MKETIKYQNLDKEFWTAEKCFILEASNSDEDSEVSIARVRVEPGVTTCWHRLNGIAERYYILEGRGIVEIGDLQPKEVSVGDVVLIPPSCRQRIKNIDDKDLMFLAICSPRFTIDAYEDLE